MVALTIRTLRPGEYHRLSALCAAEKPFPHLPDATMPVLQHIHADLPRDGWALEHAGAPVAFAGYVQAEAAPELWQIGLLVLPTWRRQGIGGAALKLLSEHLRRRGARRLLASSYSDQPAARDWLAAHGFRPTAGSAQLQLDLPTADLAGWPVPDEVVAGQGLRLLRLSQLPRHSLAERLLPLWNRTRPDQPQRWPFVPYSARRLEHEMLEPAELALPYSYAIVTPQQQPIALALNARAGAGLATVYLAVDQDFRRRGLAAALKLRLLADARAAGFAALYAENDHRNAAMLALNRRLGYHHLLDLIVYEHSFY